MPGIAGSIYNTVFRRNAVYLCAVFGGAFLFEVGFDQSITRFWDWTNQGRQWKDIKHRYVQTQESEEDDDE